METKQSFSLRKLSVGLASVVIGISFASSMNSTSVKADTVNSGSNDAQTVVKNSDAATKIDAKGAANAAESNTESASEVTKKDPNAIAQDIKQKAMKASEAVTKLQDTAEKTTKGNAPEAAVKNETNDSQAVAKPTAESTLKSANLIAKQQNTTAKGSADAGKDDNSKTAENDSLTDKNNALKATVEAAKQGLETPEVIHSNSNENTLNIKGGKAIAENMLKEGKENQVGFDPAKSKLKLATLLATTGKKLNAQMLSVSKVISPAKDTNGGFDEATWGKLDVNDWQGSVQGDYYQLTRYTGDANHVIVPNEADFEKAGISTSGKQVGVTSNLMHTIFADKATTADATVAFSKTDNKMVKAIDANWHNTWNAWTGIGDKLSKFDGTNLDVSNITNMSDMFSSNQISDLSSLANWKVDNVKDMSVMFGNNQISDLKPLAKWNVSNVTDMNNMLYNNHIRDLSPLSSWRIDHVTNMSGMFSSNHISDLGLLSNWHTDHVTNMSDMFSSNHISDISPLANWDTSKVTNMRGMFSSNQISDISPLANWDTSKVTNMSGMFENTPLQTVKLTNWDFSNIDPSYGAKSIFPDINFKATLSKKTSKSLLNISSKLSDSTKEAIKDKQSELKQAEQEYEQEYQYYLTGDGKKEYDGQIQDLQEQFEQYKQEIQQEINQVKVQAEYPLNSVFGNHSKITTPNRDLLVYLVGKLPVKSDTATRTIEITFPDDTKKTINQSVGYGKYAISGTADMATHKLDMTMTYELSKWEPIKKEDGSYDLVKAHVDKNGIASFDAVQLPKIPGYKASVKTIPNQVNPANALFAVSFMALPKPVTPVQNDSKPAGTVSPATPATPEVAKPIKTEAKAATSAAKAIDLSNDAVAVTPKTIDLSDDAVTVTPKETTWKVANESDQDIYQVSNGQYAVELPHISNAQLHVIVNDSTKESILFTYKGQNSKYVFKVKFLDGHYLLTTYKIKSGKLVKLVDYNFIKSSKMINVILNWLKL